MFKLLFWVGTIGILAYTGVLHVIIATVGLGLINLANAIGA